MGHFELFAAINV